MEISEKLRILSGAAKYDVSCSSSGSNRSPKKGAIGSVSPSGICHSFTPDGRCISLLKILLTNYCIYDCSYCINRKSNDIERASFTPEEVVNITMNFYRRNYIEGLFLSSSIINNANFTMELLIKVVEKLRNEHNFGGYIHLKAIPGADEALIQKAGSLADRMSVNLELPSSNSLKLLAPDKSKTDILKPMGDIKRNIAINRYERKKYRNSPIFVPGGQSTQLIVGATKESDLNILNLSENLYNKFDLKRVYYSAYIPVNTGKNLPELKAPPTLREHRLYQGDWLLRVYGFKAEELLNEKNPNFDINFDPKTTYALNNMDLFPVEINKAPYKTLIRIPGIGIRGAQKIVSARRVNSLDFCDLKKLGVVLKRAQYFITCKGKYYGQVAFDDVAIKKVLTPRIDLNLVDQEVEQLSFFDNTDIFDSTFLNNDLSNTNFIEDNSSKLLLPKGSSTNKLLLLNDKSSSLTGEL
ncbi:putative DNA modification/repair radical SAM protein [Clostridium cellulovorans]|uniref:Elongator protein 3/MiaB/NifB n=1 Tax=Clostridium cellulovorans (strain ATCC 35296 / DSM 3052 / OCM 3 / 743B) TaxID=573061 RepID=D9STD0_CLOC7|nr:putative DNA modification/repair radical SAM protein [Clostridium cellulovorans]ADL50746.1 Elongator protein 3/MiaB/NifB [Clostridium cellulovorans 743B]